MAALMQKIGLMKHSDDEPDIPAAAKTELAAALNIDIDTLLEEPNFVESLRLQHGFTEADLDKFAELLADMVAASANQDERRHLAAGVGAIYSYLDEHKAPPSLRRYYILKDLDRYLHEEEKNE